MKLEAIFRLPEMGGIIALFVGCGFGGGCCGGGDYVLGFSGHGWQPEN